MLHDRAPGFYPDIPNNDYHGGPGISKSGLDLLHKSPELFHFVKSAPRDEDHESTADQAFGSAYHMIVLEPALFVRTYCLELRRSDVPEAIDERDTLVEMVQKLNETRLAKLPTTGDKATLIGRIAGTHAADVDAGRLDPACVHSESELAAMKGAELKFVLERMNESRQGLLPISGTRHELAEILRANGVSVTLWSDMLAEWQANNPGRIVLSEKDWNTLHAMREKLFDDPYAGKLLCLRGIAEGSFYWYDPDTGLLCRCRPDYLTESGFCIDLKTTVDASEDGFAHSFQKWRYDVQHPFYLDGINHAIDQARLPRAKAREMIFIAQEKKPPYMVGVYRLDPEDVVLGRYEYKADLATLAKCERENHYPGYTSGGIKQISMKAWHRQETARQIGLLT